MSNDHDLGSLEDLSKGRDHFALCRAIHCALSGLAASPKGTAGLMLCTLPSEAAVAVPGRRGQNRRAISLPLVFARLCWLALFTRHKLSRFRRLQSRTG